jgi:hypothetical protein
VPDQQRRAYSLCTIAASYKFVMAIDKASQRVGTVVAPRRDVVMGNKNERGRQALERLPLTCSSGRHVRSFAISGLNADIAGA